MRGRERSQPPSLNVISGTSHSHAPIGNSLSLSIAALGVVFGDIGTSPLYAIRECFHTSHGIPLDPQSIFGVLSLIFWSLFLVVSVKYLLFILKADNHGEGGIIALLALRLQNKTSRKSRLHWFSIVVMGLIGAALLYGDGIITPSISVLSAIEGINVVTPGLRPLVVPLTVAVLILLFSVQYRGTARIGAIFGPTMVLWFAAIAIIGVPAIVSKPEILKAVNPAYAFEFFSHNGLHGFFVLSAVVLCITGAEALYADIGHFGKRPIRASWTFLVFPCLLLNYFGQGALILAQGAGALENPFYGLVPSWLLIPMVLLATLATVIASQALISGAYSLTQQAIQLGYLPRTHISHTSTEAAGQIFIGQVNRLLMIGSVGLVLVFKHSSNLAAAYGIAVTGTMIITSILFYSVAHQNWKWPLWRSLPLLIGFLIIDSGFFLANLRKIHEGGWIPILIALAIFTVMITWKQGKEAIKRITLAQATPLREFLGLIPLKRPRRVPGTAVFMTLAEDVAPPVLIQHFRHNHVLHEKVVLLTIKTQNVPFVEEGDRVEIHELPQGFIRIYAYYGYMETPDISEILIYCLDAGLDLDINELSFYLGRETVFADGDAKMRRWRKKLFIFLNRNARPATDYFGIPPDQVIEIGSQIAI